MARTTITEIFDSLALVLPEYMDAINVCLVAGGLRPGAMISPSLLKGCPYRPVSDKHIIDSLTAFPQIRMKRFEDSVLVYRAPQQNLVNLLPSDLALDNLSEIQNITLGKILGFHCPGESGGRFLVHYLIPNPWTGNPNPILGQTCSFFDESLLNKAIAYGQELNQFFADNDLNFPVKLNILRLESGQFILEYQQDF